MHLHGSGFNRALQGVTEFSFLKVSIHQRWRESGWGVEGRGVKGIGGEEGGETMVSMQNK